MDAVPIGGVIGHLDVNDRTPGGFLRCDGSKVYQHDYPKLVGRGIPIAGTDEVVINGVQLNKKPYGYLPDLQFGYGSYPNAVYYGKIWEAQPNGIAGGTSVVGDNIRKFNYYSGNGAVNASFSDASSFVFYPSSSASINTTITFPAIWGGRYDVSLNDAPAIGGSCVLKATCPSSGSVTRCFIQYFDYTGTWRNVATQYNPPGIAGATVSSEVCIGEQNLLSAAGSFEKFFPVAPTVYPSFTGGIDTMWFRVVHTFATALATTGLGVAGLPSVATDTEVYSSFEATYITNRSPVSAAAYIRAQ